MTSFKQRLSNMARKIGDSLGDDEQAQPNAQKTSTSSAATSVETAETPLEVSFASAMRKEAVGEDSTNVTATEPGPSEVEEEHGEGAIAFLNFINGMGIADPTVPDSKVIVDVKGTWDVYGYQEVDADGDDVFQIILTRVGRGDMSQEFTQVFQRGMKREYALVRVASLLLPGNRLLVGDNGNLEALNSQIDMEQQAMGLVMTDAGLLFAPGVLEVGISELRNRDGDVYGVLISSEV